MDKATKKTSNDRRNVRKQHVKNGTANWLQPQAQPKPLMNLNLSEVHTINSLFLQLA